jgi:hypothetical protein
MKLPNVLESSVCVQEVAYVPGAFNQLSQGTLVQNGVHLRLVKGYRYEIYDEKAELAAVDLCVGKLFPLDMVHPDRTPLNGKVLAATTSGVAELWNRRMAHLGITGIPKLPDLVDGMPRLNNGSCLCTACLDGKFDCRPFTPSMSRRQHPLDLVHSHICGPMEVPLHGGSRYFILFIDDATRWTEVEILKEKSEAPAVLKWFKAKVEEKHGRSIKALQTDGGGEYTSKAFAACLQENGIEKETTARYTPQENGVAERATQTIVGRARCMLFDAGLAKKFWAEAVRTAVYLKNISMTVAVMGKTPFEALHRIKPDLRHLRVFGYSAFIRVSKEKRRKWV